MTIKRNARFARGSGCYTCRCCKHLTRKTGDGDGAEVLLCELCYEIAGIENEASDYGDPEGKLAAEIAKLQALVDARAAKKVSR